MSKYEIKARLYPGSVVVAPLALLGAAFFSSSVWWRGLAGLAVASGLHFLLMQFVRDLGAARQPQLWQSWGGSSTTRLLRWNGKANLILQQQRHSEVSRATGIALPTSNEEAHDALAADHIYEAATEILRNRTRGVDLVEKENANYGYRRNLYGCRSIGIVAAAAALIIDAVLTYLSLRHIVEISIILLILSELFSILWLTGWIKVVTPDFVKRAADRYGDALIQAAAQLGDHGGQSLSDSTV